MLSARSLLAFSLIFSFACLASAEQIVFLNFGSATETQEKDDQDICGEDGGDPLLTMKKEARLGFRPTDLGFDNNDNRAMCIQDLVDQVTEDYEGLNITFVTEAPKDGDFTTINIITGRFPDYNQMGENFDVHVDQGMNRAELTGGIFDGLFFDFNTMKIVDNMGNVVRFDEEGNIDNEGEPVCLNRNPFIDEEDALGIAQDIDEGNMDPNKQAWVFVSNHDSGTAAENKTELGNTISHELAHLLGLEHEDGIKGSIMGDLNSSNYGMDKGFTDGLSDTGMGDPSETDAQRKLRATLPAKVDSEPRTRSSKMGDTDQHGTSTTPPPVGNPLEDSQNAIKESQRINEPHVLPQGAPLMIPPQEIFPTPLDPPFMDIPLPNGEPAFFDLPLQEPGLLPDLVDMWIEIRIANLDDTNPENDTLVFVDGLELPGALDGVNTTLLDDPFLGLIHSRNHTLWLPDFFELPIIESILADGLVQIDILAGGNTPWISIDSIKVTVTDNFTPPIVPCPGDCNGDGFVDFSDLVEMLSLFGSAASGPGCDPDGSGITDFSDLVQTLSLFGPCES